MLQASRRSYVCWRCAVRRISPDLYSRLRRPSETEILCRATQYTNFTSRREFATVNGSSSTYDDSPLGFSFRDRLRQWEKDHGVEGKEMEADLPPEGDLNNSMTRPQNNATVEFDFEASSPMFTGDELTDLRSDDATLNCGDLVELSTNVSRRPVLAISLGNINGYEHYYTINGKWFSASGINKLFVLNQFVNQSELEPILAEIPSNANGTFNELQELKDGPSRVAGMELLRKMLEFSHASEVVYQAHAESLDASSHLICHPTEHQYLTLDEIAERLIPQKKKLKVNGRYEPKTLYAVHRALLQNDLLFRPARHVGHNRSYLFEISPLSEVNIVKNVEGWVRKFMESRTPENPDGQGLNSPIHSFVKEARRNIDASRENREWTRSGIIGPSSKPPNLLPDWSDNDLSILKFIELWASYRKFPPHSPLQTLGATILRALGRYQAAQGYLPVTGWTFLQEVGWILPWEIAARYNVRLPGVEVKRGGGYNVPSTGKFSHLLKRDTLSHIRKPLVGVTAYCIDDITAHEIDDAVSLERTSNPEKFWIHAHVANPTSSIGSDTKVAKRAELLPSTIYLPGHMAPMIPEQITHSRFSLASGRPCLTFSALVNTEGAVLDEKITANTLDQVVFMTYEDTALAIGGTPSKSPSEDQLWGVGAIPKVPAPDRKMSRPEDLTQNQKDDLKMLSILGKAIQAKRLEKGATPFFQSRPTPILSFDYVMQDEADNFIATAGDPSIYIHVPPRASTDIVENAMKLANEVAARWCHKRDIPIPYRTQPRAHRNADDLEKYFREVVKPIQDSGNPIPDAVSRRVQTLVGVDEVSTTPKMHYTLGVDMYTKATSPLRRFGDLIVHWQIEAALLEEAKRKGGLVKDKGKDLSFLPFDRESLDRMLPMLRLREKLARILTNIDGADQYILQALVRAWKFKEAQLPETFEMIVEHKSRSRIWGAINWFGRQVILEHHALNKVLISSDVRIGDVLEVRITDINTHSRQIYVEAISLTKRGEVNVQSLAKTGGNTEKVEARP
ncbi:hypothetical protein GGS21DRAFT_527201 [Xylaria nigripes]|nr:hypothetical protein GGS21DRAFT_527201 [Xylaria nigripes]